MNAIAFMGGYYQVLMYLSQHRVCPPRTALLPEELVIGHSRMGDSAEGIGNNFFPFP